MNATRLPHALSYQDESKDLSPASLTAIGLFFTGLGSSVMLCLGGGPGGVIFRLAPGYLFAIVFLQTMPPPKPLPFWAKACFVLASCAAFLLAWSIVAGSSFIAPLLDSDVSSVQGRNELIVRATLGSGVGAGVLSVAYIITYRFRELRHIVAILLLVPLIAMLFTGPFFDQGDDGSSGCVFFVGIWQAAVGAVMAGIGEVRSGKAKGKKNKES